MFKVATWNVNSLRVRLPQVVQWLQENQPDVLAIQETKVEDKDFPILAFQELGYQAVYAGQKTYNGVAILSRHSLQDSIIELPNFADTQRRLLTVTTQDVRIINLYVPNGQSITSEKYMYKLTWLEQAALFIQQQLLLYPKLVVLGDFNIAPTDADVHDPVQWRDQVLVSVPERQALQRLISLGLVDTFRLCEPDSNSFTWWDYRAAGFRRNLGLRIDHILANLTLAESVHSCQIDKLPRAWERPSDHAPVVTSFAI